jgi:hypothetical protein
MDNCRPDAKDSYRDDGGLTEAIAPAHGDNAKDAYRQVGKANLEPERDYRSAQPIDSATESEMKSDRRIRVFERD